MFPADVGHVTEDSGQQCDGHVCSVCTTCSNCTRTGLGTPHCEICECPDEQSHYICDGCEQVLTALGLL